MSKQYYVYLLTDKCRGIIYIGVTDDLAKRIWEHIHEMRDGFTKKHGLKRLVYYEIFKDADNAMRRERRLKRWNREWKIEMIEKNNPQWNDLYNDFCERHLIPARAALGGELWS